MSFRDVARQILLPILILLWAKKANKHIFQARSIAIVKTVGEYLFFKLAIWHSINNITLARKRGVSTVVSVFNEIVAPLCRNVLRDLIDLLTVLILTL